MSTLLEMPKQIIESTTPEEAHEAIFDIDGTLTQEFAFFSFIRHQAKVGLIRRDAEVLSTIRQMEDGTSGGYEKALGHVLIQHAHDLKGRPEREVQEHAYEFYNQEELFLPFAKPTIRELEERNFGITIVSGGAHFAVEAAARFLEIRRAFSTRYATVENEATGEAVLTGKLDYDLATSGKKGVVVLGLRKKLYHKNPQGITIYWGDSDGDIFALHLADDAYVVRGSKRVREHSRKCGWNEIPEEELQRHEIPKTALERLESLQRRRLLMLNNNPPPHY